MNDATIYNWITACQIFLCRLYIKIKSLYTTYSFPFFIKTFWFVYFTVLIVTQILILIVFQQSNQYMHALL